MTFVTNKMNWPSEHTRGYQIAEALGCKVNEPIANYDETIVAVKTHLGDKSSMFTNLYCDFIDSVNTVELARRLPSIKLIAVTDVMRDFLKARVPNDIVVIPEHTCNFARETRQSRDVEVVGYVGSRQCFDLDAEQVGRALEQIGLKFVFLVSEDMSVTRKDVCEFYKRIDIQIAFRTPDKAVRPPVYRNPLKVFNAGSFRVPTVAYPELAYRMYAGTYFLEALDLISIIDKCYMLKNDTELYSFYSNRAYEWSKQFDIEMVAKEYAKLSPNETFDIARNVERMRRL